MEGSTHDIMIMPCQHRHAGARLPVPDTDRLVIASTDDPWMLVVELDRADVVKVPMESEEAAVRLVVPHLNLVIITCNAPKSKKP